ncbi:hypothetical protein Pyn_22520 [Prunus yedoensis var. nudiflora]|uniref:Uncharacterized protein n=1 Tax=Prunus yedoensis var. nudiflora TaxID=2094558 RepID=A0A314ZKL4_PRUYE|nr:hypothetical protein Pyn_22520 [Prunus yedoensis var. nudiflora]
MGVGPLELQSEETKAFEEEYFAQVSQRFVEDMGYVKFNDDNFEERTIKEFIKVTPIFDFEFASGCGPVGCDVSQQWNVRFIN